MPAGDFPPSPRLQRDFGHPAQQVWGPRRSSLALVRGRPFGAVASRELPWADLHITEMICLITDVAHALAERHERTGQQRAARDAALRGLRTESESEVLEAIVARTGV